MSKLYAISAFEDWLGGLHGVKEDFVVECEDEDEADEIAANKSHELISSFGIIDEAGWEDEAEAEGIERESDEFYDYIEECEFNDVAFMVKKITKETTKSIDALNDEISQMGFEDFCLEYCEDNVN